MIDREKAFAEVKKLLKPYAKYYEIDEDTDDRYVLIENLTYSETMFGYAHTGRGGVRLIFYPLQVFPELREKLPKVLAMKLKSKCILTFASVGATERTALAKLFKDGHKAIVARRKLLEPDDGYFVKPPKATNSRTRVKNA